MPYVDPNTIHDPVTGTVAPAAWGDVVRDDLEFLVDPPAASVFNNAAVSVANDTLTTLNADSENFDNDAIHSTVTNPSRLTAQTAGRYEFTARVNFQADTTDGRRVIQLRKNGAGGITVSSHRAVVDGNSQTLSGFLKDIMIVGDYWEVRVLQNAGNALDVTLQEFTALFITR